MKYLGILCLSLLSATIVLAQKTIYDNNAVKREIPAFKAIDAAAGVEVIIQQGSEAALAVSVSDPTMIDAIKTVVENDVLKIVVENDWKVWKFPKNFKVKVYVSYTHLHSLKASSGASIKGTVKAELLTLRANSGGAIYLDGVVEKLDASANSGGIIKGYDLQSTYLVADVNSGGGVQVTVNKEIDAKANSGGFVTYKGEAVIKNINVNSGGSVKKGK
jgi:hypothetical protein